MTSPPRAPASHFVEIRMLWKSVSDILAAGRMLTAILILALAATACGSDSGSLGNPPPPGPRLDLSVNGLQQPDTIAEGGSVVFTITVKNLGPIDATGVIAGDTLSSGLTYVSSIGSNGTSYSSATHQWLI